MAELTGDEISNMLANGWVISGYSVCMAAAGALVHNVLMQKDRKLISISIGTNRGEEIGRNMHIFAPSPTEPPKKKGFFG
jgi:hypothetical protein